MGQLCFFPYQCCNCARVRKQEGELCTVSIKEFSFRGNSKALAPPRTAQQMIPAYIKYLRLHFKVMEN